MNNFAKIQLIVRLQKVITLLLLFNILLVNGCSCNKRKPTSKPTQKEDKSENVNTSMPSEKEKNKSENVDNSTPNEEEKGKSENVDNSTPNEVIVFFGNPGVGKSTLCNSIFQQAIFKSGARLGSGLTTHKQEYMYDNKLYIDTPGLEDIDIQRRKQAAREIENSLKQNNNYKIIFVATLDSGRIRPADLVTINRICDAIKTHFNYGIIFNKITNRVITKVSQKSLDKYLTKLNKKPSLTILLKQHREMEDEEDIYFQANNEDRQKLLDFISALSANKILDSDIGEIDIRDFQGEIHKMEQLLKNLKTN